MSSTFGKTLQVTVFGQSHSPAIGCVVEGLPSGFAVDRERLSRFMARRAPGQGPWATTRKEADEPEFVSGLNPRGETCGAPLCAVIRNTNTRSQDYANLARIPRPSHADWPAEARWHGAQDVAGGGHFSGRLTAPLSVAGGIALQMLEERGVSVAAHLLQVGAACDEAFAALGDPVEQAPVLSAQMEALAQAPFPVLDAAAGEAMRAEIEDARQDQDSVGGLIECVAVGVPVGVGSPMFDGIENLLARALFGVPAVKSLEFGRGAAVSGLRGSEHNDPWVPDAQGRPVPQKNDAGGLVGGLTTGAPVLFTVGVKPTASIGQPQPSVDLASGEPAELRIHGRHDPCIAPRAVPVVEAVTALVLLDALLTYPPEAARF